MTTVAYVLLSHENPRQLRRLVARIREGDPDGYVIVQHDRARSALAPEEFAAEPRVHVMTPTDARRWGRYSVTSALLDALAWASANVGFDWITVLSGQDYPIQPLSSFRAELDHASCDAFVSARPVPPPRPLAKAGRDRYLQARYYYRWYELPPPLLGWAAGSIRWERLVRAAQRRISFSQPLLFMWSLPRGGGDMIGLRRLRLPFDEDFRCYWGSQWMTLSRRAVKAIESFTQSRPDVVRLYRRTIVSDESLLATIVLNDHELRVRAENHHYVTMTGEGDAHSAVLRREDFDALQAAGKPFARKFDDRVDSEVLDLLDATLRAGSGGQT